MESEARYLYIGASMILLITVAVLSLLYLSDISEQDNAKRYIIYFREHSLSGLQIGGAVRMKGIKIGTVESVQILSDEREGVRVTVRTVAEAPVHSATRAIIERNILTGLAAIELVREEGGEVGTLELLPGEYYPLIKEGTGEFEVIRRSLSDVILNLGGSLQKLEGVLTEENTNALTSTLHNLEALTGALAAQSDSLPELIQKMSTVAEELYRLSKSLNRSVQEIKGSLTKTSDVVARESSNISRSVRQTARSVANTAERYEDPEAIILGPSEDQLGPGEEKRGR